MAFLRACRAILMTGALVAGCGGSSGELGGNSGGDAGEAGSTSGGDAATSDAGSSAGDAADDISPSEGGLVIADAGDAGDAARIPDSSDAQGDVVAPLCPDVRGAYSITPIEGQGCGSAFNASAPQCIRQGQSSACGITFDSKVSGGGNVAINGDAALQGDGTFAGATLTEGTSARTGCTGAWVAGTSTMTVDCGGTGSSQACVLALLRTSSTCN
jgi:hypothetical protein